MRRFTEAEAEQGFVWVKGAGWMERGLWDEILAYSKELKELRNRMTKSAKALRSMVMELGVGGVPDEIVIKRTYAGRRHQRSAGVWMWWARDGNKDHTSIWEVGSQWPVAILIKAYRADSTNVVYRDIIVGVELVLEGERGIDL